MTSRILHWLRTERGRLARFLVVGGGFSLFYSIITASLISFYNAPAYLTAVIVWSLCVPIAFMVQKRYTFRAQKAGLVSFAVYLATQVASLSLVAGITTRYVTGSFVLDTIVLLFTAGTAALLSYLANRYIAFKPLV